MRRDQQDGVEEPEDALLAGAVEAVGCVAVGLPGKVEGLGDVSS